MNTDKVSNKAWGTLPVQVLELPMECSVTLRQSELLNKGPTSIIVYSPFNLCLDHAGAPIRSAEIGLLSYMSIVTKCRLAVAKSG